MVDVYSLNPQVLPSRPLPKEEHYRTIVGAIVAVVVLIILAAAYWWWASRQVPAPAPVVIDGQAQIRANVALALSKATPATQEQINSIASQLAKAKPVSDATKQSVADQLQQAAAGSL